ncbi:MAG: cysteine desulfurase family protein [Nanoarchaeota archaeon]|nr:cysteine desulfurase [Nanoarchaeota archaeon]
MKKIYLDNAATTQVDERVSKVVKLYFDEKYGNASSLHIKGQEAKLALEESRHVIAKSIYAKDDEIIFTSGGTESNNLSIKGLAFSNPDKKHIITTKIEHDCVLNACKWFEGRGYEVTYLNVDKEGFIDLDELKSSIRKDTLLVSVIHGNNEIGVIQDLEKIGKICKENHVLFHTDACQSYKKTELDVQKQNLDLVTLNAHKIHGPKGVGALYIKRGIKITPLVHGGGQEKNIRSGTENISGIVGFAEAVRVAKKIDIEKMTKLRDKLINGLEKIKGSQLNGPSGNNRLCNNINFSFEGVEGEAVGGYLDAEGICSSTGSACSSKSLEPSHVLIAIGLKPEQAHGSLRLSLSRFNTEEEIDKTLEVLPKIIEKLRKISPFEKIINRVIK